MIYKTVHFIFLSCNVVTVNRIKNRGSIMETLLLINWIAFIAVTAYGIYLFAYVVNTRYRFINLGKKTEFDLKLKERMKVIWTFVFGLKKVITVNKSGIFIDMMLYGIIFIYFL